MSLGSAIVSGISSIFGGLFGFKKNQTEVVKDAVNTLATVVGADAAQAESTAKAIDSLYSRGNILERSWRPLLMYISIGLVVARWFGFIPPHLSETEIEHLYTFIYIGLGGYLPLRSLDKWMKGFQIGKLLNNIVGKKVL